MRRFISISLAILVLVGVTPGPDRSAKADEFKIIWTLDTKSPSYGSGAAADIDGDGKLEIAFGTYFNDSHLYVVNAEDGSVAWKHKSNGGPFDASVAIGDVDGDQQLEVLTADSADGTMFCLDGQGKVEWKMRLPSGTDSPPAVADLDGDGAIEIVVGTMIAFREGDRTHGRVVALDAKTHEIRWTAKIRGHVQSGPALVDLNGDKTLDVIVTNWLGDNAVYALNGRDGLLLWKHKLADKIYHGVSVFRHDKQTRIAAVSTAGDLCLLDANGKQVWRRDIAGYCFAPTTVADLDADGTSDIVVCSSRVYVFDAEGNQKWKSPQLDSISRGVGVADMDGDGDLDLVFPARRRLHMLDGPSGKALRTKDLTVQGHVYERMAAPLLADFDNDGTLDVFIVAGKGTSDKTRGENYGRAFMIQAGRGFGNWLTFRGNMKRTGTRVVDEQGEAPR